MAEGMAREMEEEPEQDQEQEQDVSCHTCHCVLGTSSRGEVRYDKVWLCLPCHLMERELKKVKGKAIVERVLQQCGRCNEDSTVSGNRTPTWFCYDCHQYLCTQCEQEVHSERKNHVCNKISN